MSVQGVIFDLDGVLVSTDEYHYLGWKRLADEEGIPFTRADNHRQRGVSRMESLEIVLENAGRTFSEADKREMAERKNRYYVESLQALSPDEALPGARSLLEALKRRGFRLAVGSSSRNAPLIMKKVDLCGFFDAVADGNDITRSKPDPEVFLLAAERLGLDPAHCLVIEDAEAGVDAARAAGMRCIGIGDPVFVGAAAKVVGSVAEITLDMISQLECGKSPEVGTPAAAVYQNEEKIIKGS
jgi:beta-phosphoglucomutase